MIYNKIYDFCKIRNESRYGKDNVTHRFKYLMDLLDKLNIDYEVDVKRINGYLFSNIYAFGDSFNYLCAHHDVVDINSDNANDDSASIINMIAYKKKNPGVNIIITDGEEPPNFGIGAQIASNYFKQNNISVQWILNLELTGKGENFFIDDIDNSLSKCIISNFPDSFSTSTPFNDSHIFRKNGFQSTVITTFDIKNGEVDFSLLGKSHGPEDKVENISTDDMKYFTENVVDKIVKKC